MDSTADLGPVRPTPAGRVPIAAVVIRGGQTASAGRVQGRARVIHTWDEADTVQPGDILVTGAASARWAPLLALVAGLVTDAGGILSNGAIIARHYGIPAIVGAAGATGLIGDGQLVEVDGDAGVVRILCPGGVTAADRG